MRKLMFAMVAALSFAAVAHDADGLKGRQRDGGFRRGPRDRMAMMERGGIGADTVQNSAAMAVMNPKVAEKIGLSEEVREQVKKLDQDNRTKVRELQEKTRAAMEKQAQLMKADTVDEAAVMAAIDELFECRREMAKSQTRRLIGVRKLLTPEQLAKATEAMKALREERMARRLVRDPESGDKPEAGAGCERSADFAK